MTRSSIGTLRDLEYSTPARNNPVNTYKKNPDLGCGSLSPTPGASTLQQRRISRAERRASLQGKGPNAIKAAAAAAARTSDFKRRNSLDDSRAPNLLQVNGTAVGVGGGCQLAPIVDLNKRPIRRSDSMPVRASGGTVEEIRRSLLGGVGAVGRNTVWAAKGTVTGAAKGTMMVTGGLVTGAAMGVVATGGLVTGAVNVTGGLVKGTGGLVTGAVKGTGDLVTGAVKGAGGIVTGAVGGLTGGGTGAYSGATTKSASSLMTSSTFGNDSISALSQEVSSIYCTPKRPNNRSLRDQLMQNEMAVASVMTDDPPTLKRSSSRGSSRNLMSAAANSADHSAYCTPRRQPKSLRKKLLLEGGGGVGDEDTNSVGSSGPAVKRTSSKSSIRNVGDASPSTKSRTRRVQSKSTTSRAAMVSPKRASSFRNSSKKDNGRAALAERATSVRNLGGSGDTMDNYKMDLSIDVEWQEEKRKSRHVWRSSSRSSNKSMDSNESEEPPRSILKKPQAGVHRSRSHGSRPLQDSDPELEHDNDDNGSKAKKGEGLKRSLSRSSVRGSINSETMDTSGKDILDAIKKPLTNLKRRLSFKGLDKAMLDKAALDVSSDHVLGSSPGVEHHRGSRSNSGSGGPGRRLQRSNSDNDLGYGGSSDDDAENAAAPIRRTGSGTRLPGMERKMVSRTKSRSSDNRPLPKRSSSKRSLTNSHSSSKRSSNSHKKDKAPSTPGKKSKAKAAMELSEAVAKVEAFMSDDDEDGTEDHSDTTTTTEQRRQKQPPNAHRRHNPAETWICECGYELRLAMKFCGMCAMPQAWTCAECNFDQNLCVFQFCGNCAQPKNAARTTTTKKAPIKPKAIRKGPSPNSVLELMASSDLKL